MSSTIGIEGCKMRKLIIIGILIIINLQIVNGSNILNRSLFKFKRLLLDDNDYVKTADGEYKFIPRGVTLYDTEFITNDKILYSTDSGLYLRNLKTDEIKTLIQRDKVKFKDKMIYDNSKWGQMEDFIRINDDEFYFLNMTGLIPSDTDGFNKYNLKDNTIVYLGRGDKPNDSRKRNFPPVLYQPDNFKLEEYGIELTSPLFDPNGKYMFALDPTKMVDKGPFYRFDLKTKEKKLMIQLLPDLKEQFIISKTFIFTETMPGPIVMDYNGNVLQWYSNLTVMYGGISPDNKYAVFNCGIYDIVKKKEPESSIRYMGLVLFDIDQEVLNALIKYSKSLEKTKESVRLNRNKDFGMNVLEKLRAEKIEIINDSIYKVVM